MSFSERNIQLLDVHIYTEPMTYHGLCDEAEEKWDEFLERIFKINDISWLTIHSGITINGISSVILIKHLCWFDFGARSGLVVTSGNCDYEGLIVNKKNDRYCARKLLLPDKDEKLQRIKLLIGARV